MPLNPTRPTGSASRLPGRVPSCPTRLRPLLRSIDSLWIGATPPTPASVRLLLEELHDEMSRHFDAEESGGYMAEVRASAPWLAGRIDDLLAEHSLFRKWSEELLGLARRLPEPGVGDLVEVACGELRDSLLAHEREEDELAREVFQVGLGGS